MSGSRAKAIRKALRKQMGVFTNNQYRAAKRAWKRRNLYKERA